jgi:hypothetical protein
MTTPRQKREQKSYTDLLRAIEANGGVECEQLPDVFFQKIQPGLSNNAK